VVAAGTTGLRRRAWLCSGMAFLPIMHGGIVHMFRPCMRGVRGLLAHPPTVISSSIWPSTVCARPTTICRRAASPPQHMHKVRQLTQPHVESGGPAAGMTRCSAGSRSQGVSRSEQWRTAEALTHVVQHSLSVQVEAGGNGPDALRPEGALCGHSTTQHSSRGSWVAMTLSCGCMLCVASSTVG
jgi:hypothetical protein